MFRTSAVGPVPEIERAPVTPGWPSPERAAFTDPLPSRNPPSTPLGRRSSRNDSSDESIETITPAPVLRALSVERVVEEQTQAEFTFVSFESTDGLANSHSREYKWDTTAVLQPFVEIRGASSDKAVKPHFLRATSSVALLPPPTHPCIRWRSVIFFNLTFFGSVIVALAFSLLPLAAPSLGFNGNWLYLFVWFPLGVSVVAAAFDSLTQAAFLDMPRPWRRRLVPMIVYVVIACATLIVPSAVQGFPTGWAFACPVLCNVQFIMMYFTFHPKHRREAGFYRRYLFFYLILNAYPLLFLVYIIFFLVFSLQTSTIQIILLGCYTAFNVSVRVGLMVLTRQVNPRSQQLVTFYQEYLSNFTMIMALPNTASVYVYLLTLGISCAPILFYPIRLYVFPGKPDARPSLIARFLAGDIKAPHYTTRKFHSVAVARAAAVRETLFRSYVVSCLCQIYTCAAFLCLFPTLAYGPQSNYFPFIQQIVLNHNVERAMEYAAITCSATGVLFTLSVIAICWRFFHTDWRLFAQHIVCTTREDTIYFFFIQLLIYLLAECILGTHFGSPIAIKAIFGVDITYPSVKTT